MFCFDRFSPTQSPRLIPSTLPIGLPSPSAGRPPVVVATPPIVGPDGPWVPRQAPVPHLPIAPPNVGPIPPPRMSAYPTPPTITGPSFSRRGRPPSDANAARQEPIPVPPAPAEVPAAPPVTEPLPTLPAQNQVRDTVKSA